MYMFYTLLSYMDMEASKSSEANFQNLLLILEMDSLLMTLIGISNAFLELTFYDKKIGTPFRANSNICWITYSSSFVIKT